MRKDVGTGAHDLVDDVDRLVKDARRDVTKLGKALRRDVDEFQRAITEPPRPKRAAGRRKPATRPGDR